MKAMHKIAFMGDKRSLLMFRSAGFSLFTPKTETEATKTLELLKQEQYAIIFVTEQVYTMAKRPIQALDSGFLPAVIVLPGYAEHQQLGMKRMDELIENAVGMKL